MQNGGAYSLFPNLNITVTSRKSPVVRAASPVVTLPDEEEPVEEIVEEEEVVEAEDEEEEEEIDDDEEEELDDVEPVDGATVNGGLTAASELTTTTTSAVTTTAPAAVARKPAGSSAAPPREFQSAVVVAPSPKRRIGTLKFVRTADGKGYTPYHRRQTDNLLQKAKATAAGTKKKKRFFRGGNYRFDGKSGKKKKNSLKTRSSAAPSEAGSSDAQLTLKDVPSGVMELEEADVLSYLGIQRRGSEEELENEEVKVRSPTANKAKKSFRPTVSPSAAAISER